MKAILETKNLVKYYGTGENLVKAIDLRISGSNRENLWR